jgi:hypothetical protein
VTTIDLETLHLAKGAHPDCGDGHGPVCLMEAVACFAGNPFSDHPETTSPVLAAFGRPINDAMPNARRQDLKQFIPRLVATSDQAERDVQRGFLLADWSVRTILPMSLESACAALSAKAEKLRTAGRMTTADEFGAHVAKLAAAAETLRALAPLTSRAAEAAAEARVAAEAEAAAAADPVWDECIRFFGDLIDCAVA